MAIRTMIKQKRKAMEKIRDEVHDLEAKLDREKIPAMRKRIGECYSAPNSYSSDRKWILYSKIIGVTSAGEFIIDQFQSKHGRGYDFSLRIVEFNFDRMGWTRTTDRKFRNALSSFRTAVYNLGEL